MNVLIERLMKTTEKRREIWVPWWPQPSSPSTRARWGHRRGSADGTGHPLQTGTGTMRFEIIGAGAIGCVVGAACQKGGRDVTLVDQWPDHVEAIKRVGLRLSGTCGERLISLKPLNIHGSEPDGCS
jgi:hypothetical protein